VSFTVETDTGARTIPIECPRLELEDAPLSPLELEAFRRFASEVNARGGVVLEIGSRLVSPEAEDYRRYFPDASRYIGVDVHPSETVDVVGDAHFLSALVGERSVDAVFSMAVLEHLSWPWLVAAEINRTLRADGLVFHLVPHSCPTHEVPNDFWRFSDEGLKVLFGPATGFEVLDAGMRGPVDMYSNVRRGPLLLYPLNPGYANAYVLARKVRDLDPGACVWPIDAATSSGIAGRYPRHGSSEVPS
jgi:SAM-dependent methyltransferase